MRLLAFLLLAFVSASEARAQVAYSFTPNPATTSDIVRLRIDIYRCFDEHFAIAVDASGGIVTARFDGDDTLCDDTVPANTVTPRFVDIGQLATGSYEARVVGCVFGTDLCQVVHSEPLVVATVSDTRFTIPMLSTGSMLLLMLAAFGLAAWTAGRQDGGSS